MSIFLLAGTWADSIIDFFQQLGPFGFFLLEALNVSFFYLPLANELLMLTFIRAGHEGFVWVLYVVLTAAGAVVGVLLVDIPVRKAGERGLERFVKPKRIKWLKSMLARHAGWLVLISAMLPPPFPFRAVVLTASGLQSPRVKMLAAIFCGRLVRFTAEAFLLLHFGRRFIKLMQSDAFAYVVYACLFAALVGSVWTLSKWLTGERRRERAPHRNAAK